MKKQSLSFRGEKSYFCTAHLLPWPVSPGDWKETAAAAGSPSGLSPSWGEARRAPTWGIGGPGQTVNDNKRRRQTGKHYDNMNACVQMLKNLGGDQEEMTQCWVEDEGCWTWSWRWPIWV